MAVSRRLKVALIVYRDDPSSGGALRVGQLIAQNLPADQVEATLVFAYGGSGPISESVTVATHFLKATSSRDWACWKRTRSWFDKMQFDVLHFIEPVNWVYFTTLGIHGKRIDHYHGRPIHEAVAVRDRLIAISRRWWNDAGFAISHGSKRTVARLGWMPPAKLHIVYNAIDVRQFDELTGREVARKQLGLPVTRYLFGMVARISEGNGVLEVVEVLKYLSPQWHGVIVGDGPLRHVMQEQSRQLGLADRLHWPGALGDVRPAYAALDAVLFLGRYQPFCLMLAEALLAQVPIVGLQGAGEYTEPENPLITSANAVLFPRVNPWDFQGREPQESYQKVAVALQDVVEKNDETRKRVEEGKNWVRNRFPAERQAGCCLDVYRKVAGINQDQL